MQDGAAIPESVTQFHRVRQNQGRSDETAHVKVRVLKESMLHISVGEDHDHGYDFLAPAVCNAEVCVFGILGWCF